jgi:hypothetical protein
MTKEIIRFEPLAVVARAPTLSESLAYFVAGDTLFGGMLSPTHGTPGPADIAEAKRILPELEHLCRPPTSTLVTEWCKRLVPHLPKAPAGPDELRRVVDGILLACHDIPFAAWTVESAAAALKVLEWWPTPAKISAILEPFGKALKRQRDGVERVAEAGASKAPTKRYDPTPEALEHVGRLVKEFTSERSFNDPNGIDAGQPPKALHLSDGQLLAEYDRIASEGGPLAEISATRARTIRAKL